MKFSVIGKHLTVETELVSDRVWASSENLTFRTELVSDRKWASSEHLTVGTELVSDREWASKEHLMLGLNWCRRESGHHRNSSQLILRKI
jgi:hypothetical protein